MSVNYDRILTALTARIETRELRPHNNNYRTEHYPHHGHNNNNNNSRTFQLTCYICGELGHISRECISERAPVRNMLLQTQGPTQNQLQNSNPNQRDQPGEPTVQILPQAHNVNLYDLEDVRYYPEEEEAFVTPVLTINYTQPKDHEGI